MTQLRMLSRTAAVVMLAASGVVAFATIAPGGADEPPVQPTATTEAVAIRAEQLLPSPAFYVREERFQRGETLGRFLLRLGVADDLLPRLSSLRSLKSLRPGVMVRAEISAAGVPRTLAFLVARETLMQIVQDGEDYRAAEYPAPLQPRVVMKSGLIESSLFAATDDAGIPDSIGMQLADIFGGEVDFYRDLRKGDRFAVVYEEQYLSGLPVHAGRVLAAEFTNQGRTYRAVHYGNGYYTPEGDNLRKAFLRAPLKFSRISSGFGRRMHPFMKRWRQHKGIDYAAPIGTPVRAVGDGVVEFAGVKGGYGKVVILRHRSQYTTTYAHMSRFASGIKRGVRVEQSDTIGYVGQTGWATGPHLHYEFRVAGQARDPFSIVMPAALPVPASQLPAFQAQAAPLVARLNLLSGIRVARLD